MIIVTAARLCVSIKLDRSAGKVAHSGRAWLPYHRRKLAVLTMTVAPGGRLSKVNLAAVPDNRSSYFCQTEMQTRVLTASETS
jgi:hypothetical protein